MSCVGLLLAAAFLWLFQCIVYQKCWQKGLSASVAFSQEAAVEGEIAALDETVVNAKYFPVPALHVKFQMGKELVFVNQENSKITDQNYRSDIFSCLPWQQIRRHLEFRCKKRGLYTIRQLDLASYDLLWSSHFAVSLPAEASMIVYPGFVKAWRLEPPLQQLFGAMSVRNALLRDPFELQSVRDYTSEDMYRDINWKATAKTGGLKVNVHVPAASWSVMLLLDGDADRLWEDFDLKEETVRLAATLTDGLIARGIPVALRSNAHDCVTGEESGIGEGLGKDHLQAVLEMLARLDMEGAGRRAMERLVEEQIEARRHTVGQGKRIYILLSPCQREGLAKAYSELCGLSAGSEWILPLRAGDERRLKVLPRELEGCFYPWEVGRG